MTSPPSDTSAVRVDWLERTCDCSAAIGALVLLGIACMTTVSVIGRAFFVMECVEGRVMWEQALSDMTPAQALQYKSVTFSRLGDSTASESSQGGACRPLTSSASCVDPPMCGVKITVSSPRSARASRL